MDCDGRALRFATMPIAPILGGTYTLARARCVDLRGFCEVVSSREPLPHVIPEHTGRPGNTPVALRAPCVLPGRDKEEKSEHSPGRGKREKRTYEPMAMGKSNYRRWGKVIDVGHGSARRRHATSRRVVALQLGTIFRPVPR